ncbi:MAG: hypothetical protein ACK5LY_10985 [Lachnospirales bacterium]
MRPEFNLIKKGYNPIEVDEYIQELENVIKSYKDKDNAIKNALINAEIASDNIIKNAKLNAAQIKYEAEETANKLKNSTQAEHTKILAGANSALDSIVLSVNEQKNLLFSFQKEYENILNKYVSTIQSEEYKQAFDKLNTLEARILNLKVKEQGMVQNIVSEQVQTEPQEKKETQKEKVLKPKTETDTPIKNNIIKEMNLNVTNSESKDSNDKNLLNGLSQVNEIKDEIDMNGIGEELVTKTKAKSDIIAELQKASSVASALYDKTSSNQNLNDSLKNKKEVNKHNLW